MLHIISWNIFLYSEMLICDFVLQYIFLNWTFLENHLNDNYKQNKYYGRVKKIVCVCLSPLYQLNIWNNTIAYEFFGNCLSVWPMWLTQHFGKIYFLVDPPLPQYTLNRFLIVFIKLFYNCLYTHLHNRLGELPEDKVRCFIQSFFILRK